MKHIVVCSLFAFALVCCHPASSDTSAATSAPDPLDSSSRDASVRPQDNFFLFANGGWIKTAVIPPSQSSLGAFSIMADSNVSRLRRMLDSLSSISGAPKGSLAQQTGDLYASGMDSAAINAGGYNPIKQVLARIDSITDFSSLLKEIGKETSVEHNPFFSMSVGADDRNSLMNIVHLDQGGLGLPSKDYYFKQDSAITKIRNGYIRYMVHSFIMIGEDSAKAVKDAGDAMALEYKLAALSKSPVDLRDPVKNYNKVTVIGFSGTTPAIKPLLTALQVQTDTLLMGQPAFIKGMIALLQKTPLPVIKDYLKFHVIVDDAPYLSDAFVNANFEFTRLLTGQSALRPRWKRMTSLVDNQLGDALGQIFVKQYFPAAAKQRISELVDNILSTYAERLQQLDWMSDSTKTKALVKLKAIVKKVGYPDKWKDYTSISIDRHDLVGNVNHTTYYEYERSIRKIGKPVDRTEWSMTPPTINAYYDPTANNINFPAGILAPPFFSLDGDDAVNYGAIGFVIGHEITHGFDDQGRQYDGDGNLKDWWSKEDAERFKKRAENIIRQYNNYLVIDTLHLNGELTEGENIADNGGVAISFAAFKKTPQGKGNVLIDNLTPDQRFFLSAAQVWKRTDRSAALRTQVMTNPHSTAMYRVNGPLSNIPAFYQAFNVQPTDSMYRADSIRVKIW